MKNLNFDGRNFFPNLLISKKTFVKGSFFIVFAFCGFSNLYSQKKTSAYTSSAKKIRHVVHPHESFNSIGKLYGLTGVQIADFNNLEYFEGEVFAKYLTIPRTANDNRQNIKSAKKVVVPVSQLPGTTKKEKLAPRVKSQPQVVAAVLPTTSNKQNILRSDVINPAKEKLKTDTTVTRKEVVTNLAKVPVVAIDTTSAVTKVTLGAAVSAAPSISKNIVPGKQLTGSAYTKPLTTVDQIYVLAKIQLLLAVVLVALIFLILFLRNKKEAFRERLNQSIRKVLISEIIGSPSFSENINRSLTITEFLKKQLAKKATRQFVIDELISGRKNLKGQVGESFLKLYLAFNLQEDSVNKLKSKRWDEVSKGIQELAIMEQKHKMNEIFNEINSKNEYVRMEAQIALVHLSGFGALWFLNVLNYPMSEFQQIKLINQLSACPVSDIPDLKLLLSSPNESLVNFTLKLIGVFQQRTMHNTVVKVLENKSESIRFTAMRCLKEIYNNTTAGILIKRFADETRKNKLAIINIISQIGQREHTSFLLKVLALNDDTLRVAAARALSNMGANSETMLEEYCSTHGEPYSQIYLHIKSAV